ncbi:MAG: hypothetical protein ABIJ97_04425 [Bacteroidota bacterium]
MRFITVYLIVFILYSLPGFNQDYEIEKKHFRAYVKIGYSQWYMTKPDSMQYFIFDYIEGLEQGLNYEAGFKYYFLYDFIAGISFSHFQAYNYLDNVGLQDNAGNIVVVGYLEDEIDINFTSLYIGKRLKLYQQKCFFEVDIKPGIINYTDKQHFVNRDYKYTGSTFGTELDLMVDFIFTKHFGMGLNLSYLGGSFDKLMENNEILQLEVPEKMDRVNFNINFSFYF